ncbi:MAG: hypothetical protein KAR06_04380 [Deltaproteobacteria bacterium]|nr:hypothetical protein [Deltaproteobacteria bacterium]
MANEALQVEHLLAGLRDTSGNPLVYGKVYTYVANGGFSDDQLMWTDADKTSAAANPIILDGNGQANVYGDGLYDIVIRDEDDVILYTWLDIQYSKGINDQDQTFEGVKSFTDGIKTDTIDEVTADNGVVIDGVLIKDDKLYATELTELVGGTGVLLNKVRNATSREHGTNVAQIQDGKFNYAADTGIVNAYAMTLAPAVTVLVTGLEVKTKIANANTITTPTLAVNATGAKAIVGRGGQAIEVGDLPANVMATFRYTGTQWELLNQQNHHHTDANDGGVLTDVQSDGSQVIAASATWTPTVGIYQIAVEDATGALTQQLYITAVWRGWTAGGNGIREGGRLGYFDGTNMRFIENSGLGSVKIWYQKFTA